MGHRRDGDRPAAPFRSRWVICGTLTTCTPLHVGTGELLDDRLDGEGPEVSAVVMGLSGNRHRPWIPGSAIRGALRQYAKERFGDHASFEKVFGSADTRVPSARGGTLDVGWARVPEDSAPPDTAENWPHWNDTRFTAVQAFVAIDRQTRTAAGRLLAHREFVPPGVPFELEVRGYGWETEDVAFVLKVLEGFNDPDFPVRVGASRADGWGVMRWKRTGVWVCGRGQVKRWAENGAQSSWRDACRALTEEEIQGLERKAPSVDKAPARLRLEVTLEFLGPFLVNDPSRCGKGRDVPDHSFLRDEKGRPFLPGKSFRGALRSQAERILRTMADRLLKDPARGACQGCTTACNGMPLPETAEHVNPSLCPACCLFGAPGWKTPVGVSAFRMPDGSEPVTRRRHFVAIDRFTGGAAPDLKFDAEVVEGMTRPEEAGTRPLELKGTVSVDTARLGAVAGGWAFGLLFLLLRDLVEGDIRFGMGAAKGFGAVRASISAVEVPQELGAFREALEGWGDPAGPHAETPGQKDPLEVVQDWVRDLETYLEALKSRRVQGG